MTQIKELKIFSFAKFQSILTALLGLVSGILYSFGGLLIGTLVTLDLFTTSETSGLSEGTLIAFGALIGMPLIFATFGYLCGILEAILYNIFVKLFKGIHLDLK